jgi:hypothetical protein
MKWTWWCLSLSVVLWACPRPAPEGLQEVAGTRVHFDVDADLTDMRLFFRLPYPSDARLTEAGTPDLRGFPNFQEVRIVTGLTQTAAAHRAYPVMPVAYFELDGAPSPRDISAVIPASPDAPLLLLDVDADSPQRGKLFPVLASVPNPDDYVPDHLLAVAPRPGMVLRSSTTYAFVVMRSLQDGAGRPLGVPLSLVQLKAGQTPAGRLGGALARLYAPLWETLRSRSIPLDDVAAATVFTTGDVVADLHAMTQGLMSRHAVEISGLRLEPTWGTRDQGFCTLVGTTRQPQFQVGTPPFDREGLFSWGQDGLPVPQGELEVPVVITLPRQPMPPAGFPLVLYVHGSGGSSDDAVNAGPAAVTDGPLEPGKGPAHTVAPYGWATACTAMPVNPERLPGASDYAYLNLGNPSAVRDTFRQGVIELRLYLEALRSLQVPPALLEGCAGISLPQDATAYHFAPENLAVMGQSMGGWYTNLLSAVEPRVKVALPTGAGGYLSYFVLQTQSVDGAAGMLGLAVGTLEPLTFMHPTMHVLDTACEAADPIVHVPHLALRPLPGHPARSIYEPVGRGDVYFATPVFDAMALAYGNRQAGQEVWPDMQQALALDGRQGLLAYPVTGNLTSDNGQSYTGVVVQYEGDGIENAHYIYRQLPAVKSQVGCFLDSWLRTGHATVMAPGVPGEPCVR